MVENLSMISTDTGFASSLQAHIFGKTSFTIGDRDKYARDQADFHITGSELEDFKDEKNQYFSIEEKNSNGLVLFDQKSGLRVAFVFQGKKVQQLNQALRFTYIFLISPSLNDLKAIQSLKISRAVFSLGTFPGGIKGQLKDQVKIIYARSITDFISRSTENPVPVFFFSNQRIFTG